MGRGYGELTHVWHGVARHVQLGWASFVFSLLLVFVVVGDNTVATVPLLS